MNIRSSQLLLTAFALLCWAPLAHAVTVQDPGSVLDDGSAYLWVEGEDASLSMADGSRGDPETGLMIVTKANPIKTKMWHDEDLLIEVVNGNMDVLKADANASGGGALFHQLGSGGANTATWEVQFAIPATYYLYLHYSFYNRDDNTNYGNEDSIYLPPAFNMNSRSDWIGFEGVDGEGNPMTGDSDRDGWMPLGKTIVDKGNEETHNSTDEDFWDGMFHWALRDEAVQMDANNQWVDDLGMAIQYDVAEGDVGTVLEYQISAREQYGVIDGLLFSTSNTLLQDFTQAQLDEFFIQPDAAPAALEAGDADQDLDFDQLDLVQVQVAAKYLSGQPATWGEGDWNGAPGGSQGNPPTGNGLFDQLDIVAAQQAGKYLTGPYAAIGTGGQEGDNQTSIKYHLGTGEVGVDAPAGVELTSVNIDSAASIFTGDPAMNLGGSFDNDADDNIFKATFGGSFGSISFGNVAQAGLSEDFVAGDLTVVGSLAGGGDLGNVDLIYIPEPSASILAMIGALSLLGFYRRQRGK